MSHATRGHKKREPKHPFLEALGLRITGGFRTLDPPILSRPLSH